jgi:protein-S-isoprenylcysteine O-methyltransferase
MTALTASLAVALLLWVLLESFLEYAFRSPDTASKQDRWSSKIFNGIIACSVAGWFVALISAATDDLHQKPHIALYLPRVALALLTAGLLLRSYAVFTLKKHFTVDLAIQHEHQLIQHGPYRILRHPSYTGALLCFSGLALSAGFWGTTMIILVPVGAAYIWRIQKEEGILLRAFGERYTQYCRTTYCLVPWIA